MGYRRLLYEFMAEWARRVRKGEVTQLDGDEIATLNIFCIWLDERKEKGGNYTVPPQSITVIHCER